MILVEYATSDQQKTHLTGTFSLHVIRKILLALQEKGRVKRTNLAAMAGLNYKQCIKYVNLLLLLGWACTASDQGYQVLITETGSKIVEKLVT